MPKSTIGHSPPDADSSEPTSDAAESLPGTTGHEDWLLDESLGETFPASDPIAPATPSEPDADVAEERPRPPS